MKATMKETDAIKTMESPGYNYVFNKKSGFFIRWGAGVEDDPQFSPFGPELLDIEISTGDCSGKCPWCYKGNEEGNGTHMSARMYEEILRRFPKTLTQVALGITDVDANEDLVRIMEITREMGYVPNYTMTGIGLTDDLAMHTARLAGAVSVSVYPHTVEVARAAIQMLREHEMGRVNIHLLYHKDNAKFIFDIVEKVSNGEMGDVDAVVLLALKPVGRGSNMEPATRGDFSTIVNFAMEKGIPLGFDSCSAHKWQWVVDQSPWPEKEKRALEMMAEPCESGLFSIYVDVNGGVWPCSFIEGNELFEPIDILGIEEFFNDVWFAPQMVKWRENLIEAGRACPAYDV